MAEDLVTSEQAKAMTHARRTAAVENALRRFLDGRDLATATAQVLAAYEDVTPVVVSECPDVHPEWGQCVQQYGHEGDHYTGEYDDPRRPDGSHPWDY